LPVVPRAVAPFVLERDLFQVDLFFVAAAKAAAQGTARHLRWVPAFGDVGNDEST
jgi:hypothetical protein